MWISQATSSSLKISTCYKCIEDGYSSNPHVCVLLTVASPCLCTAHCCKSMFVYCSLLQVHVRILLTVASPLQRRNLQKQPPQQSSELGLVPPLHPQQLRALCRDLGHSTHEQAWRRGRGLHPC